MCFLLSRRFLSTPTSLAREVVVVAESLESWTQAWLVIDMSLLLAGTPFDLVAAACPASDWSYLHLAVAFVSD